MADNDEGGRAGLIAELTIYVVVVALILVGLCLFRGRIFGEKKSGDVNITAPAPSR